MSDVNGTLARMTEIRARMEAATAQLQKEGQAAFADGCKALFAEHPTLASFGWKQYTPYFNDGDECVFRVCGDYPDINGVDGDDIAYVDEHAALKPVQKAVEAFIGAFPTDILRTMFGDHAEVKVTADGATTESYEHD